MTDNSIGTEHRGIAGFLHSDKAVARIFAIVVTAFGFYIAFKIFCFK